MDSSPLDHWTQVIQPQCGRPSRICSKGFASEDAAPPHSDAPTPVFECLARENSILEAEKDPQYWFEEGNFVIQIGRNRVANVHRSVLRRHSSFFNEAFNDPTWSPSEDSATLFDDGDFRELLRVLYPRSFAMRDQVTAEEWGAVLRASTHLRFSTIRELAIEQLSAMPVPVDKIVLGRAFDVPDWLEESYIAVCEHPEPLTEEEGSQLGLKEVIRIMCAREAVQNRPNGVVDIIRDVFELETPGSVDVLGSAVGSLPVPHGDAVSSPLPTTAATEVAEPPPVTRIPAITKGKKKKKMEPMIG